MSGLAFLEGTGAWGELYRRHDWAATELGPLESWPRSLKTCVHLVLRMPRPAIIFWGPHQRQLYNAGYADIMGPRHPRYFGGTYAECWPDTYPTIHPWMRRVLDAGEVIEVDKALIPVTRHGFTEEAYFTFSFVPLRDDTDAIAGFLQPVDEVTQAVLAERRLATLAALALQADLQTDTAVQAEAALRGNAQDLPFAALYVARGEALQPAVHPGLASPPAALDALAARVLQTRAPVHVDDVGALLGAVHHGPWPEPTRDALALPLQRFAGDACRGVLVVGLSPRLRFDAPYQAFCEAVAHSLATSLAMDEARAARAALVAELARREAQLGVVTDALPGLVSYVGRDERYHFVNRAYTQWFGLERAQVQGRQVREVLGDEAYAAVQPFIQRALAGESCGYEREMAYRIGGPRHTRASFHPHRGPNGEVDGFVALVLDVTQEARGRRRERRMQAVTSALMTAATPEDIARALLREAAAGLGAQSGMVHVHDAGGLRLVAAAGYPDAIVERFATVPLDARVPVADVGRTGEALWLEGREAYLARYPHLADVQAATQNRTVAALPLVGRGGLLGVLVAAFREERPLEEADRVFLEALAQQAALALERARLYEEAQGAVRVREEFLSVAAHELRTPLTSLKLQLQRVQQALPAEVQARVERPLTSVVRQVGRLGQLVEGLLDISRLAQGRLALELGAVDAGALAHEVADRLGALFIQAGCALAVEAPAEPVLVRADVGRLDQVLVNLLSNAAKYGAGAPVTVRVRTEGGRGVVEVQDAGIGIAPEALPRLFGRFERAVSERHYGGLGLGLYISRQLVEAMGGRIQVESQLGRGATFRVELELAAPAPGRG